MKRRNPDESALPQQQRTEPGSQLRAASANNPDTKISEALFNLTFRDRSEINEEMHGVSCMAKEETPELLEESLEKFHLELNKIDSKPAYDRACEIMKSNPSSHPEPYIHTKCYKQRFLRCELFDARRAAKRYSKYLDLLLELHGEKSLHRPIRMADLDRVEMSFLREGQYQVLPVRDRSGRRIICLLSHIRKDYPRRVLLKVYLYIWESLLGGGTFLNDDEEYLETQRKGVVIISISSDQNAGQTTPFETAESLLSWNRTRVQTHNIVGSVNPVRVVAVHICSPNSAMAQMLTSMLTMLLSSWLPRLKFHFGEPLELRYQLQGYGIPTELIPSTDTGNVKSANLKQWIKLRRYLEWQVQQQEVSFYSSDSDVASDHESAVSYLSSSDANHIVECPASNDVIFRRGKAMNYHPGNVKFLNLIESNIQEHTFDTATTQTRRMEIEEEIMRQVRDGGGRFLTWEIDNCWWVDMSKENDKGDLEINKEIQRKIHYAFRDFRKKLLKSQHKLVVNTSSTYAFERQDGQKRKRYNDDGTKRSTNCTVSDECTSSNFELLRGS